jgi:nucleoside-diphosphate-sugar epimerase
MKKILVTGGLGFLGSHITKRLVALGEDVTIFARSTSKAVVDNKVPIVWGDIRDAKAVEKAVNGATHVIHLVSNFRKGGSDKNEAYDINVKGTENVLSACKKNGIKRLVHCSTIGVHGSVKEIPASEKTGFNPGDLYQSTKLEAEKRVWKVYNDSTLPITVIRPISMFGPGDLRMLKLFRMIKKKRFIIIGDGMPFFQPAYIDDVVNGFLLALEKKEAIGEAFIVGGDEYVRLNKLCEIIAAALNVPPPRIRIPLKPVLLLADICEKLCVPFGIEPPIHRRRVSFFQNNRAFTIEKVRNILGFEPQTTLQEGVRKTIKWYEKEGLI